MASGSTSNPTALGAIKYGRFLQLAVPLFSLRIVEHLKRLLLAMASLCISRRVRGEQSGWYQLRVVQRGPFPNSNGLTEFTAHGEFSIEEFTFFPEKTHPTRPFGFSTLLLAG